MSTQYSEVKIRVNGEVSNTAFSAIGRELDDNHVKLLFEKMKAKGYRQEEPVQVFRVNAALIEGMSAIFNINGKLIPEGELNDCYLLGEGNHRCKAASLYNDYLREIGEEEIIVPAIEISLVEGENLIEWISEKNSTKKEWSKENYVRIAAEVHKDEPLLQKYNELIITKERKDGFSLSTLNKIYCNGRTFSRKDLILLCSGAKKKGKGAKVDIIPQSKNIEVGDRFISLCKQVGFTFDEIKKRYIITQFNDLRDSQSADFAFSVLEGISEEDRKAMKNDKERLDEQLVIDHFKAMKDRLLSMGKETTLRA